MGAGVFKIPTGVFKIDAKRAPRRPTGHRVPSGRRRLVADASYAIHRDAKGVESPPKVAIRASTCAVEKADDLHGNNTRKLHLPPSTLHIIRVRACARPPGVRAGCDRIAR